jgi:hypothetical protein
MNHIKTHKYYTANGKCSAGKTHSATRYAVKLANKNEKIIIAQPSKKCIGEWHPKTIDIAGNVPVFRFDGNSCEKGHVKNEIMAHMKESKFGGEIIFVTQQALMSLPYTHNPDRWHLIIDEIPPVDIFFSKHLTVNHRFLTDAIEVIQQSADTSLVEVIDEQLLRRYAENKENDDIDGLFKTIAQHLLSDHYRMSAINENYDRTVRGDTERGKYPLYLYGELQPSVFQDFKTTTIMGACLEESLLFQMWSNAGVEFEPHEEITKNLRFIEHTNGHRLEIYYPSDEKWSKRYASKSDGETSNNVIALTAAKTVFGDEKFIYLVNKDAAETASRIFKGMNAEPLPYSPHGLNEFDDYNNVLVIASFLPQPYHQRFLANKQIDADSTRDAVHNAIIYQAVMRGKLRDPNSNEKVKVLVPDVHIAEYLEDLFPGCSKFKVEGQNFIPKPKRGRKRIHASVKDKSKAYRDRNKQEKYDVFVANCLPDLQKGSLFQKGMFSATRNLNKDSNQIKCRENLTLSDDQYLATDTTKTEFFDFSLIKHRDFVGTLFKGKKDWNTDEHIFMDSDDDTIGFLRRCHGIDHKEKENNYLISPALFNPSIGPRNRGKFNVIISRHIWLDIDDGDLPYREFQKMFPNRKMVIYNTYNTVDDTRYRIFMPTDSYMTGETYEAIIKQIVAVVQSNGYCSPRQKKKGSSKLCHGIDSTKLYAANMMYLPCQSKEGGVSFFEEYEGEPICVDDWVENNILPIEIREKYIPLVSANSSNNNRVSEVTSASFAQNTLENGIKYIQESNKGERNNTLYWVAAKSFLNAKLGLIDEQEVQDQIMLAANSVNLSKDEVRSTMNSAKRSASH